MNQFFTEKDVIDFSKYENENEIRSTVKSAAVYVQGLMDEANNPLPITHNYLPWSKTMKMIQFRKGEVTIWAGENGSGKSLVTGQVALSLCAQDQKVCIASFEMKPIKTLARMGRQFTGLSHNDPDIVANPESKQLMLEAYAEFRDWTRKKMWLYDKQGTVKSAASIVAMCKYAARELHCSHIFVDNLAKCVRGEDDYNGQKDFVEEMTAVARDEDVHIHVVHHVKKPDKAGGRIDKYAVKGSGSITDQPDNCILVMRNKAKEHDLSGKLNREPDTILTIDKMRDDSGYEGDIKLWFNRAALQFVANDGDEPMSFYNPPGYNG